MIASTQSSGGLKSTYRYQKKVPPRAHHKQQQSDATSNTTINNENIQDTTLYNRLFPPEIITVVNADGQADGQQQQQQQKTSPLRLITYHLVATFQSLIKTFKKKEETDFEEITAHVSRYKPKPIDELVKLTRFSKKEIQNLYRGFKQECPSGIVNEQMFKEIYAQFFPQGDCSNYAHFVFTTIDANSTGSINFEDFLIGLSVLSRGTLDEKLRWIFNLYDINRDGKVTKDELLLVVTSVYELMGSFTDPIIDSNTPRQHVEIVFKKLNSKQDGVITMEDFLQTCYNDETILNSISMLDTVF